MKWWKKLSYPKKQAWAGRLFILPWFIGFICIFCKSLITSFVYSVSKISLGKNSFTTTFVGFKNYIYAFQGDVSFTKTLVDTLVSMLYQVPLILVFSLIIACILNQNFKGRLLARAIFFLPVIIATGQVISIMRGDIYSQQLFSGERSSSLFTVSGIQSILLSSGLGPDFAKTVISLINSIFDVAWKSGIQILLFLSALQTVPRSLYEVGEIEGATAWEAFWKITFPMISPIVILNLVYTIIDNFTDYSNKVMMMSSTLAKGMKYEYSATITWIYFLIIVVILAITVLVTRKRVFYIAE